MLTIGELSRTTGVKVTTIRYYESTGLLPKPERSGGNQRRYSKNELERLSFIRHGRELGLTIEAIRDLIVLSLHPDQPCDDADRIAAEQLSSVRLKIDRLKKLEGELERIASGCHSSHVRDCYVIRALASQDSSSGDHK